MKMKNLNPLTGYNQIVNGYFSVPRVLIMELVLEKKISINLLGYVFICLIVADWDDKKMSSGFIRYDMKELANLLNISKSSLYANLKALQNIGFLQIEDDTFKIVDYQNFQLNGSRAIAKTPLTAEKYLSLFPILTKYSEKLEKYLRKSDPSFRFISNISSMSNLPPELKENRKKLLEQKSMFSNKK